jgi:hypothetical protein
MIRLAVLPQAAFVLAAMMTYLAHGALWLGAAWVTTRPRLGLDARGRNLLWRAALVGPVLSTVLALGLSDGWRLTAIELALTPVAQPGGREARVPLGLLGGREAHPPAPSGLLATAGDAPAPSPLARLDLLALALAAVSAARLLRLGVGRRRFWRRMHDRQPVLGGPARGQLSTLVLRARLPFAVRLSLSARAGTPMALGRGEICLPPRALLELEGPALSAVLAHELAHLERRDNGWLTVAAVIRAALFFAPLNAWVSRELDASAEQACDERAVALTDSAVALARSIAVVAAWHVGSDDLVPVAPMARPHGDVLGRVKALLDDGPRRPAPERAGRGRVALAAVIACGLLAPAFGEVRAASDGGTRPPPAKPPAPSDAGTRPPPAKPPAPSDAGTRPPPAKPSPPAPSPRAAQQRNSLDAGPRPARVPPAPPAPPRPAASSRPSREPGAQPIDETSRRLAEELRHLQEDQRRVAEAQRQVAEALRRVEGEQRRVAEADRRVEEAGRRVEGERRRVEEAGRRVQERRREVGEEARRRGDEERRRADERRQGEEARHHAEDARRHAEEERRRVDERRQGEEARRAEERRRVDERHREIRRAPSSPTAPAAGAALRPAAAAPASPAAPAKGAPVPAPPQAAPPSITPRRATP